MKKSFVISFSLFIFMTIFNSISAFGYPSNAMVRVCIMDNNYRSVEKTFVTIYGTSDIILKDCITKREILHLQPNTPLDISRNANYFMISYRNEAGELVETTSFNNLVVTCPEGILGVKNLVRGGKPAMYRGEFRLAANPKNPDVFYLINYLDVEYYLKGVVPCEMPVSFGHEALKAQAVAARNYSISPRTKLNDYYDVVDSVASQVYNGYNREDEISNKAIDETHGIVALYNDEMIMAVFSSTAGGYTESYSNTFSDTKTKKFPSDEKPYLVATPDLPDINPLNTEETAYEFYSTKPKSYDIHSPLYRWTRTWTKEELEKIVKTNLYSQSKTGFVKPAMLNPEEFGNLECIKVTRRGDSGKIISLDIETDKNTYTVEKELVIRRLFTKDGKAMPSANFVFKYTINDKGEWTDVTAYGGGFGHGCGLSQFGAMYMAKDCKLPFDTILKHYYKGISLGTKPVELNKSNITQCFYAPTKKAVIIIPNKKHLKTLTININDEMIDIDLSDVDTNKRCSTDISEFIQKGKLNTITFYALENDKKSKSSDGIKIYIKLL